MSLFACEECGTVENTALCGWVSGKDATGGERRVLLCSECNPEIGEWHGLFARRSPGEAGLTPVEGSYRLEAKARGVLDWEKCGWRSAAT